MSGSRASIGARGRDPVDGREAIPVRPRSCPDVRDLPRIDGGASRIAQVMRLQSTAGNAAVGRLLAPTLSAQRQAVPAAPAAPANVLDSLTVAGGAAVAGYFRRPERI